MKKLFLAIFLLLFTNTLYGQGFLYDIAEFIDDEGLEILPLRYELNISEGFQLNHEFSVGLINFYFENSTTGLGFGTRYILPKYYYNFQDHVISFLGINIYWNIFKLLDSSNDFIRESIFGPCFSLDYLNWNLSEPFITMFYNYNFKIGIRYSKLWIFDDEPEDRAFMPIFNFEVGYKNTNGISDIYLSIQTSFNVIYYLLSIQ